MRLHDGSTGLGSSRLLWPRDQDQEDLVEVQREGGWPLGTNQASVLTIWVSRNQLIFLVSESSRRLLAGGLLSQGRSIGTGHKQKPFMELCVHMSLQSDLAGHKVLCSFGEVVSQAAPGNLLNRLSIFLPFCSRNLHLSTALLAL